MSANTRRAPRLRACSATCEGVGVLVLGLSSSGLDMRHPSPRAGMPRPVYVGRHGRSTLNYQRPTTNSQTTACLVQRGFLFGSWRLEVGGWLRPPWYHAALPKEPLMSIDLRP